MRTSKKLGAENGIRACKSARRVRRRKTEGAGGAGKKKAILRIRVNRLASAGVLEENLLIFVLLVLVLLYLWRIRKLLISVYFIRWKNLVVVVVVVCWEIANHVTNFFRFLQRIALESFKVGTFYPTKYDNVYIVIRALRAV